MNRGLAPVLAVMISPALFQASDAAPLAATRRLPMPLLEPSDLIQAAGVRMEARVPKPGMILCRKDAQRPLLWYAPSASRALDDGTVQIWYQRVNQGETNYSDQRTLCLGEIRSGKWVLPVVRPEPVSWDGTNNVVMTRSPHRPTWGGFNVFQIVAGDVGLAMLYWDQPGPIGEAGAIRAVSRDGKNWEKLPGTVFTEHNDAFCLVRIGNEYVAYQTALEPWPDKPVPDNIGKLKRIITVRTSPDLKTWSRQQPLLSPDTKDARDTEFYLFKVFRYGRGYAGLIMKYYADPAKPGKHSAILRHELAVSEDGRTWLRPYRDTELGFWSYADPFPVEGRLHFATWKDGAMVTVVYGQDRLVAVTGAGSFGTPPFVRPQKGIALDADASQGWMEATLCDRAGDPVRGVSACRIEGIEGASISLPWKHESLPVECALRIRLCNGAKVFGVAEK